VLLSVKDLLYRAPQRLSLKVPFDAVADVLVPLLPLHAFRSVSRRQPEKKQHGLIRLVHDLLSGTVPCHALDGRYFSLQTASRGGRSVRKDLRTRLHSSGDSRELMELLFEANDRLAFAPGRYAGHPKGLTAGYRLKPEVEALLDAQLPDLLSVVDQDGRPVDLELFAFRGTNWAGGQLPAVLRLNPSVQATGTYRRWASSLGGIPNLYAESVNGRLVPGKPNALGVPHIILTSAPMREKILKGSGLTDLDLSAAYQLTYIAMCDRHGLESPAVRGYLQHKAETREFIAQKTGHPAWLVKEAFIAALNGSQLFHYPKNLGEYPALQRVMQEFRQNVPVLFRQEQQALGKEYVSNVALAHENSELGRKAAYLFQGVEQLLVRALGQCIHEHGGHTVAVIYDGVIANVPASLTTTEMENYMAEKAHRALGLQMRPELQRGTL
jgi:hypothetical protein